MLANNIFQNPDYKLFDSLIEAWSHGVYRDEVKMHFDSLAKSSLSYDQVFDVDALSTKRGRSKFIQNIEYQLNIIFGSLKDSADLKTNIHKVPINSMLNHFQNAKYNLCIVGDKRLTMCYYQHELPG
jgi:hypothetical protein